MLTIETGVKITQNADILKYKNLLSSPYVSHIQIAGITLDGFPDVVDSIFRNIDERIEISYKPEHNDLIKLYENPPKSLFAKEPKFLIVPLEILTTLEQAEISSFSFFESLITSMHKRFICIEVSVTNKNTGPISNAISSLINIKEALSSYSIMYSLKLDRLNNLSEIKNHIKELNNYIGLIDVNLDINNFNDHGADDYFVELIDLLYWLPYRQQPLIFSNSLHELEFVLKRFEAIVRDRGYNYF